jgi:spore cortex formation protein SpoVR/YcgB (stage V sporulation)
MRCEKAKKLIVDYIYQELSEKQRKKLEEHLAQCWGCSFELESFQKTINIVESQTEMEESEQFW